MAIAVIDRLEVVHVHGYQRQRLAKALGTLALQLQRLLQPIAVGNAGQRIALGQLAVFVQLPLQLLVYPGQLAGAFGHLAFQRLVPLLQLHHQALVGVDVAVGTEHARHRAILVMGDDVAAVFDPQVAAIVATAAVFDQVMLVTLVDVRLEMRHHPRVVLRVDHTFPGEHRVGHGVAGVAEHGVPAWVAIDVAGIGIPVPDTIADQIEQRMQLLLTEAGRYRPGFLTH
ncbi:hypothetical protein D3C79_471820 [compost metagenome]